MFYSQINTQIENEYNFIYAADIPVVTRSVIFRKIWSYLVLSV